MAEGRGNSFLAFVVGGLVVLVLIIFFALGGVDMIGGGGGGGSGTDVDVTIDAPDAGGGSGGGGESGGSGEGN